MQQLLKQLLVASVLVLALSCAHAPTTQQVPPPSAPAPKPEVTPVVNPVVITVSPNTVKLTSGTTEQYTVQVLNTTNTAVTWGSCASDSITQTGLFTAPVLKTSASICVYAISQADPSKVSTVYATVSPIVDKVSVLLQLNSGDKQVVGLPVLYTWTVSSSAGMLKTITFNCGDGTQQVQNIFNQPSQGTSLTIVGSNSVTTGTICNPVVVGALKASLTVVDTLGQTGTASAVNTTLPVEACPVFSGFGYTLPSWITALTWTSPADNIYGGTQSNQTVIPITQDWLSPTYTVVNYGMQYCLPLAAGGGFPPYTFSGKGLPPGMTVTQLSSTIGLFSGVPSVAGNYTNMIFTVTDSTGKSAVLAPRSIEVCIEGNSCNGTGN